jgi:hypothetical protein
MPRASHTRQSPRRKAEALSCPLPLADAWDRDLGEQMRGRDGGVRVVRKIRSKVRIREGRTVRLDRLPCRMVEERRASGDASMQLRGNKPRLLLQESPVRGPRLEQGVRILGSNLKTFMSMTGDSSLDIWSLRLTCSSISIRFNMVGPSHLFAPADPLLAEVATAIAPFPRDRKSLLSGFAAGCGQMWRPSPSSHRGWPARLARSRASPLTRQHLQCGGSLPMRLGVELPRKGGGSPRSAPLTPY